MSRALTHDLPEHWTPTQEAFYRTVHEYADPQTGKRGPNALGPKVSKQGKTLSMEANPDDYSHKLGLEDSIPPQLQAGDFRTLYAYAQTLGHIAIQLPQYKHLSDMELLDALTDWHGALGQSNEEIRGAMHPDSPGGRDVTAGEFRAIEQRFEAHMRRGLQLLYRLRELAEECGDEQT